MHNFHNSKNWYISASISVCNRAYAVIGSTMAAFRANSYSRYSNDDEDTCMSYFAITKYHCLHCEISICNKCSVFEDNEEAPGWTAGKSVGHCEACIKELGGKQKSSIAEKPRHNSKPPEGMLFNNHFPLCSVCSSALII